MHNDDLESAILDLTDEEAEFALTLSREEFWSWWQL